MSKKCKLALLTVAGIVLALILAGCGKVIETPWDWVQNLSKKDIDSAYFFCNQDMSDKTADDAEDEDKDDEDKDEEAADDTIELSEKDLDKLFMILYRLGESDFSENTKNAGTTPSYGLMINMTDGNVYYINESIAPQGALEMKFGDKMWFVDSDELNEFIQSFLTETPNQDADDEDDEDKDDDEYSSEGDLEPADVSTYASDGTLIVQQPVDYSTYSNIGFGDNP